MNAPRPTWFGSPFRTGVHRVRVCQHTPFSACVKGRTGSMGRLPSLGWAHSSHCQARWLPKKCVVCVAVDSGQRRHTQVSTAARRPPGPRRVVALVALSVVLVLTVAYAVTSVYLTGLATTAERHLAV